MRLIFIILVVWLGVGSAAVAAPDWSQCVSIGSDPERLACYDRLAGRLEKAEQMTVVDEGSVDVAPAQNPEFGLRKPVEKSESEDLLATRVTGVRHLPRGQRIFEFANGQRWIQVENRTLPKIEIGDQVTVEKAFLGSFTLRLEGSNRILKVRRLK